jgi:hypothetical protein
VGLDRGFEIVGRAFQVPDCSLFSQGNPQLDPSFGNNEIPPSNRAFHKRPSSRSQRPTRRKGRPLPLVNDCIGPRLLDGKKTEKEKHKKHLQFGRVLFGAGKFDRPILRVAEISVEKSVQL